MASVGKAILSVALTGLVGTAAWGVWSWDRAGTDGPPAHSAKSAGKPVTTPTSAQVAKLPQTLPAAPVPAVAAVPAQPSFLYFKYLPDDPASEPEAATLPSTDFGTPRQFPAARLRVTGRGDDSATALLFSDDPKEAIEKNWTGDRYYFAMDFQPDGDGRRLEDRLNGAMWVFTASAVEKEETRNGIFLHGDQMHLEPVKVSVKMEGQAPNVLVRMGGEFLQYDTSDPNARPKRVLVMGILAPRVEMKE